MPKAQPKLDSATILSKMDRWRCADYWDSQDRAEIRRWYSGGPLDTEDEEFSMVGNQNFLLGYRFISKAFSELQSIYTKGKSMYSVELEYVPAQGSGRKKYIEGVVSQELSRVIKKSRRFKTPYSEVCGDAVLYGAPFLYRIDPYDWCPLVDGQPMMPRNAPADIHSDEFLEWGFRASLTGRYIFDQLQRADKREREGDMSRWNKKNLYDLLDLLFKSQNSEAATWYHPREKTPEEMESDFSRNADLDNILDTNVPVYWFFRKRIDKKGKIDLYCISRFGEQRATDRQGDLTIMRDQEKTVTDPELFYEESRFDSVEDCLFPFHLDVIPGGNLYMHEIMGLGRLNYDLDRKVAELINVGLAGIEDDFTPIYIAQDTAAIQKLEQFMQNGIPRNGLLPAGIAPQDKSSRVRNYEQLFGMTSLFTEAQSVNSSSFASPPSGRGRNELEVQALERQAESQRSTINRMLAWVEAGDSLGQAMFKVFTSGALIETDRGYDEVKEFQRRVQEAGIALEEIDPTLVTVKMQRLFGAGDRNIALSVLRELMQSLGMYPPKFQEFVKREYLAVLSDDHRFAYEQMPETPDPEPEQVHRAQSESSSALIAGIMPQIGNEDVHGIHFQVHRDDAVSFLETRQQTGLDPSEAQRLTVLLGHMVMHGRIMAATAPGAEQEIMQTVQAIAKQAEQMVVQPPAPPEVVKSQLDQEKLQLAARKQAVQEQQWQRSQALREDMAQHTQTVQMNQEARADRRAVEEGVGGDLDRQERLLELQNNRNQQNAGRQNPGTAS